MCISYVSYLENSKGGYDNILVTTDNFTKYAQAFATRNQTAKITAQQFCLITLSAIIGFQSVFIQIKVQTLKVK